jgi:hypothetical protein
LALAQDMCAVHVISVGMPVQYAMQAMVWHVEYLAGDNSHTALQAAAAGSAPSCARSSACSGPPARLAAQPLACMSGMCYRACSTCMPLHLSHLQHPPEVPATPGQHPPEVPATPGQHPPEVPATPGQHPPEGSPTLPVAPPSSATGVCPQRWNHDSTMMPSRLPRCRLSAVGSKPQYEGRLVAAAIFSSSSEVTSCSRPRSRSTCTMLGLLGAAEAVAAVAVRGSGGKEGLLVRGLL